MSNTAIQLKKSGVTGNTPSGLSFGEVALNYADGKLYYKNSLGGTSYISNQYSFDTINSNNSLIFAGSVSDTLSFAAGNNIVISTNTSTKTITINAAIPAGTDPGPAFNRANASYAAQNTTALFANAAFDKANAAYLQGSSGSTPVSMSSDLFTANGVTTTFTLSTTPTSKNYTTVVVDGITQSRNTYTVTGNVITFDTTFESGANLEVTTTAGGGALDPYATIVANSAFDRANAAYAAANTSISGTTSKTTGSWTVATGTNTYSITVTAPGTYQIWVRGNIPNGIIAYIATAVVTNTNVPVVGAQYAWVYNGGGSPIDFTSIPNQFTGTANTIVRSSVASSATTTRFDFGINNSSGSSQTVQWGYVTLG